MMGWEAAAIAAGANLLGGLMSEEGAEDRNNANLGFNREQLAMQKEMAQNGIRWKVEDAKAAGIHPLYALGAQPFQFSPTTMFSEAPSFGMGQAMAAAGQDISRAIDSTRTSAERQTARLADLAVERGELENEMLRSQIAKLNATQVGPANPGLTSPSASLAGGVPSGDGTIVEQPLTRTVTERNHQYMEPGAISDLGFARTKTGWYPIPSKDVKERIEDMNLAEFQWWVRNGGLPNLGKPFRSPPPLDWLPDGASGWKWNHLRQEYQPDFFRNRNEREQARRRYSID